MKKTLEDWIVDIVVWVSLLLVAFITLYPFWYIIIASFNEGVDMMRGGVYWIPRKFTTYNYVDFFRSSEWLSGLKVSVLRTLIGTILTVTFTSMVSYALSRKDLMFGNTYRFMFIMSMYVSGGLIPFYVVLRIVGLLNTFYVYVIPTMLNLFFVLVGINFFRSIPESVIESGRLDGALEITIFFRIVLPVSKPFIATLALFSAVHQWNSWLDSTYYVNTNSLRPMAYYMVSQINRTISSTSSSQILDSSAVKVTALSTQATSVVVSMFPILCVYPFLQKYFVQGMMIGSVKG